MEVLLALGVILLSYVLGSFPSGLVIVRIFSGKDVREVESGRTGGTNAMRAAGYGAGVATAVLDVLKSACAVWLARAILPGNVWVQVLAPAAAVLGHNYSIFLIERTPEGKIRLRGGAGGAPTVGGAFGLWPLSILIILPLGALVFFGIGYASVTTLSAGLFVTIIFAYRAVMGASPWQYVVFGVLAEALLVIALLPNIHRLINGTERGVGWRAERQKQKQGQGQSSS